MFILVILGYFLAVILICCGGAAAYETITLAEKSMGIFVFLKQIAEALMPAFAGVVILALVQMCKFLEELMYSQEQATPAPQEEMPRKQSRKSSPQENQNYFGALATEEAPKSINAYSPAPPPPPQAPSRTQTNTQAPAPAPASSGEKLNFFHVD